MSLGLGSPLLLAAVFAASQSSAPPGQSSLNLLLDQVGTHASAYRATIPSLTADESITSQATGLGIFKQHAEARALFRVVRKTPDGPLTESRQIVELNGKAVAPNQEPHLPLTFQGAFGDALEIFFAPALRPCFDFTLAPAAGEEREQRIGFAMHPGTETNPACAHTPIGVSGFALVDPATKQIRHLERTVPEDFAAPRHLAGFVSIDYAATLVGDQGFWLPSRIVARMGDGKAQFTARYSNYHRFTGTVTLLPNVTPVDPPR